MIDQAGILMHARDDDVVNVANGMCYADALRQAGVPYELVLPDHGGHGFGLGASDEKLAQWPGRCIDWLHKQGLIAVPDHCRLRKEPKATTR
ncbi:MAG: prolyl oligopeptidase family serine peptidase [Pseudolabrys sp.]